MANSDGDEYSIGLDWRASLMANSSRDPYWQASLRRETLDHAPAGAAIEDECSACHMANPTLSFEAGGRVDTSVCEITAESHPAKESSDGVTCSVCHQVSPERLGTEQSYNGNFLVNGPTTDGSRAEFGPYEIAAGLQQIMRSSTGGYQPQHGAQIQSAELCASCHTLITEARDANGTVVGSLPEQMVYQEWQHSDFRNDRSASPAICPRSLTMFRSRVSWGPHDPTHVAINSSARTSSCRKSWGAITMSWMWPRNRVSYMTQLIEPSDTCRMRRPRSSVSRTQLHDKRLQTEVTVGNLGGHKLPTAFPARRTWLHFIVRDRDHRVIFESGALKADGSIVGNDNDSDPAQYEPHYREIRSPDQVQIYEAILGDHAGHVTTGLLFATDYLKDNRLLPRGFDKTNASPNIAVHGEALADPDFTDRGHTIPYSVAVTPSGRLKPRLNSGISPSVIAGRKISATTMPTETRRFVGYYAAMGRANAVLLTKVSHISQ